MQWLRLVATAFGVEDVETTADVDLNITRPLLPYRHPTRTCPFACH
jgi:hypothetical protein